MTTETKELTATQTIEKALCGDYGYKADLEITAEVRGAIVDCLEEVADGNYEYYEYKEEALRSMVPVMYREQAATLAVLMLHPDTYAWDLANEEIDPGSDPARMIESLYSQVWDEHIADCVEDMINKLEEEEGDLEILEEEYDNLTEAIDESHEREAEYMDRLVGRDTGLTEEEQAEIAAIVDARDAMEDRHAELEEQVKEGLDAVREKLYILQDI